MIPYRLAFSGVRDFPATQLTFGDDFEHVLITGPNGTGKSTLAFCFGAVLNSSRVSLEGIRSNNIPDTKAWRASITLTFKNTGSSQVDGPPYIAFRVNIDQPSANAIPQREYEILYGETIDGLVLEDIFRSGDSQQRNFSLYTEQLKKKYKIFPDMYYLIWYQQEVNQFAAYSPEERFRRFSDMYGISDIQQKWETQIAQLSELAVVLKESQQFVNNANHELNRAQNELNDYHANQQRMATSGKQLILTTNTLKHMEQQVITASEKKMAEIHVNMEDNSKKIKVIKSQQERLHKVFMMKQQQLQDLQSTKSKKLGQGQRFTEEIATLEVDLMHLQKQLAETDQERKRLRYSEIETQQLYQQKSEQLVESATMMDRLHNDQNELLEAMQQHNQLIIKKEFELQQIHEQKEEMERIKKQFRSSYVVKDQIQKFEQILEKYFENRSKLVAAKKTVEAEIHSFEQNQVYSQRQQKGLQELRQHNIVAYALRDLVELTEDAMPADERRLDTIKYSIFYDAKMIQPVNDLYYVSLKSIIPTRFIKDLPQLKLTTRGNLTQTEQVFSSKILYWIEQFFIQTPKISSNMLVDERGSRGTQEQDTFILSEKSIAQSLLRLRKEHMKISEQLAQLEQNYQQNSAEHSRLRNALPDIQKAEAYFTQANDVVNHEKYLTVLKQELTQLQTTLKDKVQQLATHNSDYAVLKFEQKQLLEELEIYKKLGALTELQNQYTALKKSFDEKKSQYNQLQKDIRTLETSIHQFEDEIRKVKNNQHQLKSELTDTEQDLEGANRLKASLEDTIEVAQEQVTKHEINLAELASIVSNLYTETIMEPVITEFSKTKILQMNVNAKAEFFDARQAKINPQAPQNFEIIQKDYIDKRDTVLKTEKMIQEQQQHTDELATNLENTISMQVRALRHLFEGYMDEFGFEGAIEWERYTDKRGRTIFQLFLKVRKKGHRGNLTEVSIKARNGKFGKGVSGGEESLSSLLFALALLKNLQTSPGFILLDEFDSALDENRKEKVFALYNQELQRKLFILSPKTHDEQYYRNFSRAFIIDHDAQIPISRVKSLMMGQGI